MGLGTACVFQVSGSRVTLARRKDIVVHKTDCTRNLLIYVDCLRRHPCSERTLSLIRRRCANRLLAMANHGAAVSGTKAILQQLNVHYRPGLTNFWHACPKWHVEIFPWHAAFTVLRFFLFLLSDQRLYIVNNMCIYTHTHTSHCLEIPYALSLLPVSTASEAFLRKSGAVGSAYWTFIREAPTWLWLCEYVTTDKTLSSSFQTGRSCIPS